MVHRQWRSGSRFGVGAGTGLEEVRRGVVVLQILGPFTEGPADPDRAPDERGGRHHRVTDGPQAGGADVSELGRDAADLAGESMGAILPLEVRIKVVRQWRHGVRLTQGGDPLARLGAGGRARRHRADERGEIQARRHELTIRILRPGLRCAARS